MARHLKPCCRNATIKKHKKRQATKKDLVVFESGAVNENTLNEPEITWVRRQILNKRADIRKLEDRICELKGICDAKSERKNRSLGELESSCIVDR
jgi:hypothetical protein